jgi:hypothetical protein
VPAQLVADLEVRLAHFRKALASALPGDHAAVEYLNDPNS